jgi:hypothetical protein
MQIYNVLLILTVALIVDFIIIVLLLVLYFRAYYKLKDLRKMLVEKAIEWASNKEIETTIF